jgi:hypothetical protein
MGKADTSSSTLLLLHTAGQRLSPALAALMSKSKGSRRRDHDSGGRQALGVTSHFCFKSMITMELLTITEPTRMLEVPKAKASWENACAFL